MEKQFPPSDQKTVTPISPQSPLLSQSPPSDLRTQQFASNFTNLYRSIFPPKPSPIPTAASSPSSSATTVDDFSTEHSLRQARLILEYQELRDHYDISLSRLQTLSGEIELLRQENNELRAANNELVKVLSQVSVMRNRFGERDDHAVGPERVTLPKSISIRTADYLKLNQTGECNNAVNRPRVPSQLGEGFNKPQRVYVAGVGGTKAEDAEAVEVEVYNQGMWKTELCNKWQETGTCPYGNNCQFAHGIKELRPVIRHPRYKTQVCRMVLAGETCPYGHRCHFRHAITQQDRLLGPP